MKVKSFIWGYFVKSEDGRFARCLKCNTFYKTSGNTSNLSDHLKRAHNIVKGRIPNHNSSNSSDSENNPGRQTRQSKMKKFVQRQRRSGNCSEARKAEIDKLIIEMIAVDMQPFSIVEDVGFQALVKGLDPLYNLPSRTYLKEKLLPEAYNKNKQKLLKIMEVIENFSITTDIWTSQFTSDAYITVTCHFIYQNKMISTVLETQNIIVSHTAENIAAIITSIITNWNIREKLTCIVSDNAANMVAAANLLGIRHLPSFAHTLNLVVQESITNTDSLDEILSHCRRIVTFFKRSCLAHDRLKLEQQKSGRKELKLLQDVATRWNSTYMVKRILELSDTVSVALLNLTNAPMPLTNIEKITLSEFVQIAEAFEEATKQISGNYVTVSLVIPIIKGIYFNLNVLKDSLTDNIAQQLLSCTINSLNKRLSLAEQKPLLKIATLLDPRFKKDGFRNCENAYSAQSIIQSEIEKSISKTATIESATSTRSNEIACASSQTVCQEPTPGPSSETQEVLPVSKLVKYDLITYLKEGTLKPNIETPKTKAIKSIREYMAQPTLEMKNDTLDYWKTFPEMNLKKLAWKYLSIPAISVPSERLFSKSGQLISARRSRLKPKNVNKLLFLCSNRAIMNL